MPNDPPLISRQLLDLLAEGEAVLPLGDAADSPFVLWRRAMLDQTWVQGYGVTLVDFSSELLGLSTLWLGAGFYNRTPPV